MHVLGETPNNQKTQRQAGVEMRRIWLAGFATFEMIIDEKKK